MPLIDSNGLFDGDRINSCSRMAQLYYPRMMAASNGYGRIRIDYRLVIATAFPKWSEKDIPTEAELLGYFQEYATSHLIFLYHSAGQLWGQWDAKAKTFGKYQTTADKRSPAPPDKDFEQWVKENREHSHKPSVVMAHFELLVPAAKLPQNSEKLRKGSKKVSHGVGVGIGDAVTCEVLGEEHSAAPSAGGFNNSAAAKSTGETRHTRVKQIIQGWYQDWAGEECPWDGSEGGNLDKMLKATPNWEDRLFVSCLDNLARSDCIPKGDRPREWLCKLPKFMRGPLNEFWKAKQGNGNAETSKAERVQNSSLDAIQTAVSRINGRAPSATEGSVPEPERDSGVGGVVLDGTSIDLPRGRTKAACGGFNRGNA
jgi:hypothetical protein